MVGEFFLTISVISCPFSINPWPVLLTKSLTVLYSESIRPIFDPTALALLGTVIPAFLISSASTLYVCSFSVVPLFELVPLLHYIL
jgi:hypothetical protein